MMEKMDFFLWWWWAALNSNKLRFDCCSWRLMTELLSFFSQAIGHVSGGHINPAVTVAMFITGKISLVRALLYVVFQCAGATAGTASIKALLPEGLQGALGHTQLFVDTLNTADKANDITPMQGLGLEFFLGFILIFTVFGVCDGNKPGKKRKTNLLLMMKW